MLGDLPGAALSSTIRITVGGIGQAHGLVGAGLSAPPVLSGGAVDQAYRLEDGVITAAPLAPGATLPIHHYARGIAAVVPGAWRVPMVAACMAVARIVPGFWKKGRARTIRSGA